jgi:putative oxygen-independent coproporphyrinogen III oxidase
MGGPLPVGDAAPASGLLPDSLNPDATTPFSAYVHIPFCTVRCGYCDFNTYTATELRGLKQEDYAGTVLEEIELSYGVLRAAGNLRPLHTVFFGGGTPTLLAASDLARIMDKLVDVFGAVPDAEVTVEANPDTVTAELARTLAAAGVTRMSIGMQSAVPSVLATLDRTHDPANVRTAVDAARDAGLEVSVDLIYGTPGETLSDWQVSLETALDLSVNHISAYALIVEAGTALARRIRRGQIPAPDDDLHADMYELADRRFQDAGLHWYEVSNWARSAEHRSRHNLAYWHGHDWWGYGPGAHSHVMGLRWWNVKHPAAYAQRLAAGQSPAAARELLDEPSRMLERVLLQSRLVEGLPIAELPEHRRQRVAGLIADGLVDAASALKGRVSLTIKGRLLADAVVRELTD